jgi:hypothetical protein
MARANTSQDCCVRATSSERESENDSGFALRFLRVSLTVPEKEQMRVFRLSLDRTGWRTACVPRRNVIRGRPVHDATMTSVIRSAEADAAWPDARQMTGRLHLPKTP